MHTLCMRRPYSCAHASCATRSISSLSDSALLVRHSSILLSSPQAGGTARPSSFSAPIRGARAFTSCRRAKILQVDQRLHRVRGRQTDIALGCHLYPYRPSPSS